MYKLATRSSAVTQTADRTALSGITVQHADNGNGYYRRGNFDSLCIHS